MSFSFFFNFKWVILFPQGSLQMSKSVRLPQPCSALIVFFRRLIDFVLPVILSQTCTELRHVNRNLALFTGILVLMMVMSCNWIPGITVIWTHTHTQSWWEGTITLVLWFQPFSDVCSRWRPFLKREFRNKANLKTPFTTKIPRSWGTATEWIYDSEFGSDCVWSDRLVHRKSSLAGPVEQILW